jgi:outer membrane murein-binding lipoprotein Lpp
MFGKKDLVDDLSHDLDRARARRDALASDVTTLTAEIAALETRLSEERDRRERARVAAEIDEIAKQLTDAARTFAPAVARLADAAAAAGAVVAKAGEFSGFLALFADEVRDELDSLMAELRRRAETARIGDTAVQLTPPSQAACRPKDDDRMPLLLPAFLRRKALPNVAAAQDQRSSAA